MSKPNWKTPLTYNITLTPSYTFQLLSFSQSHFLIYSIMLSSNIKSHLKWRKAIFVGSGLMVEVSSIIKYSNKKQKRTRDTWGMRPDTQLLDGKWSSRQTSTISFLTPESLLLVFTLMMIYGTWQKVIEFARISYFFHSRSRSGESSSLFFHNSLAGGQINLTKTKTCFDYRISREKRRRGKWKSFIRFNFTSN